MSDQAEFKRQQMDALLRAKAERVESVMTSLLRANASKAESVTSEDVGISASDTEPPEGEWKPTKCPQCHGTGKVGGLFSSYDCYTCESTGFVLDDPVRLIHFLMVAGRKLKKARLDLKRAHQEFRGLWTESEIQLRIDQRRGEEINSRFD